VAEAVTSAETLAPFTDYIGKSAESVPSKATLPMMCFPHNHRGTDYGSENIRDRKWMFNNPYELCLRAPYEKLRA
jgi:hypothetical protein